MTPKPPIQPITLTLEPGKTYKWCTCGLTKTEPLCDSSHKGTGMHSLRFEVEKEGLYTLCFCKKTKNPPYCDGSHNCG